MMFSLISLSSIANVVHPLSVGTMVMFFVFAGFFDVFFSHAVRVDLILLCMVQ